MKAKFQQYKLIAIVAAVIIIPLVYSYLYLYAFWDPYSRLDKLPVAIVSEDQGATINGTYKNVGNEIIEELKDNTDVKWIFVDKATADQGLSGTAYYGSVTIPKDFSKAISTADQPEKVKGLVVYKINEKRNFLAGQVMNRVAVELEMKISKSISEEIVKAMTDEVKGLPDQLTELDDGLGEMKSGTSTLYEKTGDLLEGQRRFNEGLDQLNTGLDTASSGSQALAKGSAALSEGTQSFSGALVKGKSGAEVLTMGSKQFSEGLNQFSTGLNQYVAGVNQYTESIAQSAKANQGAAAALKAYVAAHPEALRDTNMQTLLKTLEATQAASGTLGQATEKLSQSGTALKAGAEKLGESYVQIDSGVASLNLALGQASEKATLLSDGAAKLNSGAQAIASGLEKAASGSSALSDNAGKILAGEEKLREGIQTLDQGVAEAKDKVSESVAEASDKVKDLDGIEAYTADPVDFDDEKVNPIPDYGTAFTPYFVSLSLWVGALIMFIAIYLDEKVRFRRSKQNSKGIARYLTYTGIGVAQAIVLAFVLRRGLHLEVKQVGLFYLTCIAISLAFVSIVRFLIVHLADVGKFVAILLLILQLTACGGTFPMELVPRFFQVINPAMPMTYSVDILREVISGVDYSNFYGNLTVLSGITLTFLLLNIGVAQIRRKRKPDMDPIF